MKRIDLISLNLVNFKGLRDFEIRFNERNTKVYGRNGSGKTTIFDAFTWLLFGKDSQDKKVFSIKTLGEDGEPIMHLPHEVSAVIKVNGETITLRRSLVEKWTKRRGALEAEFTGHEEERFWNDVPCSQKEYNNKISELCNEQVFKLITNPMHFEKLDVATKRALLIRMAGGINDEEIAAGNNDFAQLLANLTGKTLEEFKREVSAKKSKIKAEIEALPERIDERKRDSLTEENWQELEQQLEGLQSKQQELDNAISDTSEAMRQENEKTDKLVNELYRLRSEKSRVEYLVREKKTSGYREKKVKQNQLRNESQQQRTRKTQLQCDLDNIQDGLKDLEKKREELIAEWKKIRSQHLEFKESDFICPTCHRHYDIDEIESKQEEITASFNTRKAEQLERNKQHGLLIREHIDNAKAKIESKQADIKQCEDTISGLESDPLFMEDLTQEPLVNLYSDKEYQELCHREEELQEQISKSKYSAGGASDNTELKNKRAAIADQISDLKVRLSKRIIIEQNEKRVKELEGQLKTQNIELARLEQLEFNIQEFSKARINYIENKINSLFRLVTFKMYSKQINGGEAEVCETTVNGVPYNGGLNNAMRIIAGLDIINAICKFEGICAPIFVDNAESINELPLIEPQVISLIVSQDNTLRVEQQNDTEGQLTLF